MPAELIELSEVLAQSTDRATAGAVAVHTESRGSSSGVVWRPGVVVTAEHALRRDEEIHLTLPDGRVVSGTLAGRDLSTDIAVVKCAEAATAIIEVGDVASLNLGGLTLVAWGPTSHRFRERTVKGNSLFELVVLMATSWSSPRRRGNLSRN
jgi:S1-C subfamily serine protease